MAYVRNSHIKGETMSITLTSMPVKTEAALKKAAQREKQSKAALAILLIEQGLRERGALR